MISTIIVPSDSPFSGPKLLLHDDEILQYEGRLATALIEKWGLAMGQPCGEDSAGRQKGEIMPTAEVVQRACDIAGLAASEFRRRGWLTPTTTAGEVSEILKPEPRSKR